MNYLIILLSFMTTEGIIVYQFEKDIRPEKWQIINDNVMGGVSEGSLTINSQGHGVFAGKVSLENYGGFSSIHYKIGAMPIQHFSKIRLHVKGDGKRYQFRIKSTELERHSYIQYFETNGDWQSIELNLNDFFASFRGQKLNLPNFSADTLGEIAFLIGNKKAESFELIIDKIELK